jgi:hypothetical protein
MGFEAGVGPGVRVRGVGRCRGRRISRAGGSGGDVARRGSCGGMSVGCSMLWGRSGRTWDPFPLIPSFSLHDWGSRLPPMFP